VPARRAGAVDVSRMIGATPGGGDGYTYGFLETGLMQQGTLTFPLEAGDFCE